MLPVLGLSIELLIIRPLILKATAAEYDREAAEKYKVEIEARITCLEFQTARLTGKDNKKERSAKGTQVKRPIIRCLNSFVFPPLEPYV